MYIMRKNIRAIISSILVASLLCFPQAMGGEEVGRPNRVLAKKQRELCLTTLRDVRKGFEELARKHPKALGHLGGGVINAEKLSLHFPLRAIPRRVQPSTQRRRAVNPHRKSGLVVQFFLSPRLPKAARRTTPVPIRLLFADVECSWYWRWEGAFPPSAQKAYREMFWKAARPLFDLEVAASAHAVEKHGKKSFVLRGKPGVGLTLKRAPKARKGAVIVELHAQNLTDHNLALDAGGAVEVLQDGKTRVDNFLSQWGFEGVMPSEGRWKDPFIYLKPGERKIIRTVSVGDLKPGVQTLRVAVQQARDGWLDASPIRHDGAPIFRKVKHAWTGVVVSKELKLKLQ